jgi:hypothetical protein
MGSMNLRIMIGRRAQVAVLHWLVMRRSLTSRRAKQWREAERESKPDGKRKHKNERKGRMFECICVRARV